jgi:predicted permease
MIGLFRLVLDVALRIPVEYFAELRQDLRYGWRMLIGSPGFTAVALLSLSLGICIATSAYSELHGLILRDVPGVMHPEQLVAAQMPTSYINYRRYRQRTDLFSSMLAYAAPVPFEVSIANGQTHRKWGHIVTSSYFSTLGIAPGLGRFFTRQDEATCLSNVVISSRFWKEYFASTSLVLGKALRINGHLFTVIGVGPEGFLGASPLLYGADVFMPYWVNGTIIPELSGNALENPTSTIFHVVGRLQPSVTASQAETVLDVLAKRVERDYGSPKRNDKSRRVLFLPGGKELPVRKRDLPFFTEFFTVLGGMVLLIACANLTNMMLARATHRRKEIAVRLSLGASRARLIRQFLTESLMVAVGAGILGFCLSMWVMRGASQLRIPYPMPILLNLNPDLGALFFTFGLMLFAGLALGLVPALQSTRADITPALKDGGDIQLRRFGWLSLRKALMLSQIAGSLALLLLTGFLVLGYQTTLGSSVGLNPQNVYLMGLDPIRAGRDTKQARVFFEKSLDLIQRMPVVSAACLTDTVPLAINGNLSVRFRIEGSADRDSSSIESADKYVVGYGCFETLEIPILMGRGFRREDETENTKSVVVSQEFVARLQGTQNPIGREIRISDGELDPGFGVWPGTFDHRSGAPTSKQQIFQIVGIAGNVARGFGLEKPPPAIYFPLRPTDYATPSFQGVTLIVRGRPRASVTALVRDKVSTIDETVNPFDVRSMAAQINQTLFAVRMTAWTYGVIGVFGLILSLVGLAGMTAYSVTRRVREIGIRMALGAQNADVLRLIMKETAVLIVVGSAIGLGAGWAGLHLLGAIFSTVSRSIAIANYAPIMLIGSPLLLGALALIASYLPARKSILIDPVIALRQE